MPEFAAATPDWLGYALLAAVLGCLLALCAAALVLWHGAARLRELERMAAKLDGIEELRALLARLVADRDDLDLRRLEHVLVDIRNDQRVLVEQLLRAVEAVSSLRASTPVEPATPGERVVNRLLALGYERVQIATDRELLAQAFRSEGEVLVEAYRQGVLHKGRVVVRGGRITDVDVLPAYSIFP